MPTKTEAKIDGHVQFNGGRWTFYESLQPGLSCETADHSTCKRESKKRQEALTEADKAERQRKKDEQKAEVDAAAKAKGEEERKALLNRAGVAKHDAMRENGLKMQDRVLAAQAKATEALAKAHAAHDKAVEKVQAELAEETDAALAAQKAAQDEIEATDWVEKVSKEK